MESLKQLSEEAHSLGLFTWSSRGRVRGVESCGMSVNGCSTRCGSYAQVSYPRR